MDPELQLQAAEMWEKFVATGIDKTEATRRVESWMQAPVSGQEEEEEPGRLTAFGRGAAQGATLGFADEATSALKALPRLVPGGQSFGEKYSEEVTESRAEDRAAREAHPGYSFAGEVAGSLIPAVAGGAGAIARGAQAGSRLARTAATGTRLARQGAAMGALEGAGRAEGNPLERLPAAAVGGAVGGAFAIGLPFVGRVARRIATPFARTVGIGRRAGVRAADEILDALTAPPEQLRGRVTGVADETLMELDPGARALAESANVMPGPHQAQMEGFLEGRVRQQFPRVQEAVESGTGLQRQGAGRVARQIIDDRKAAAQELFPAAYARGSVQVTPELAEILSKPSMQRAYREAQAIAGEQGVPLGNIAAPDVRTLHLLKMGLDDAVEKGKLPGEGGLGPTLTYEFRQTRRRLLEEIRNVAPELADALDTYAGDSAMLDALELGRSRFHLDVPTEIADMLDGLTAGEVEMYRRGAVDNVLHRLGNVPDRNDLLKRFVDDPNDIARMGLLFDEPATYEQFMQTMQAMAQQGATRGQVGLNSATARRLRGSDALGGEGIGEALRPSKILEEFDRPFVEEAGGATAGAISPMMTRTGPELLSLLDLLEGRAGSRATRQATGAAATRLGSLGGGYLSSLFFGNDGNEER
jgi:hypothetical protein